MSISMRVSHVLGRGNTGSAGFVHYHGRLKIDVLGSDAGHRARLCIGASAGAIANHQRDGFAWKFISVRR